MLRSVTDVKTLSWESIWLVLLDSVRLGDDREMTLPTPRDYAGLHTVHVVCRHCDRVSELDLPALVSRGLGDVPLVELPLRCSGCGDVGHSVLVSGRAYGVGDEVA